MISFATLATLLLALASNAHCQTRVFNKSNITIAAVVAAPAGWPLPVGNKDWSTGYFDLNASVTYALTLIEEARTKGADMVVFPELWFPGYPKTYEQKSDFFKVPQYVAQSMEVGSAPWQSLVSAAANSSVYLSFGYSEREGDLIYMSQALVGPTGDVLINRRKLRPSGDERGLWSDGSKEGLTVVDTEIGRIGMLMCWEHMWPAMTFAMQAQQENIHIGPWPYNENFGAKTQPFEDLGMARSAQTLYSATSGAIVVAPAIGHGFINNQATILAESDSTLVASPSSTVGKQAIIYASLNGSSWSNRTYNINGQQSWGILSEMVENYPSYIPRENGTFVNHTTFSTSRIISQLNSSRSDSTTETAGQPAPSSSSRLEVTSGSLVLSSSKTAVAWVSVFVFAQAVFVFC